MDFFSPQSLGKKKKSKQNTWSTLGNSAWFIINYHFLKLKIISSLELRRWIVVTMLVTATQTTVCWAKLALYLKICANTCILICGSGSWQWNKGHIDFSDILLRATADVLLFILMASFVHIFKSYLSCSLKIWLSQRRTKQSVTILPMDSWTQTISPVSCCLPRTMSDTTHWKILHI